MYYMYDLPPYICVGCQEGSRDLPSDLKKSELDRSSSTASQIITSWNKTNP